MKLLSIEISNFRQFYGVQVVNFATDEEKNVTLIHAENGVGKTAFLNAILWCLFEQLTPNFKHPDDLLNNVKKHENEDGYYVRISFVHMGRKYLVQRRYSNLSGASFSVHEELATGNHSSVPNPAFFINSVVPKDMAGYFFFQGEGAGAFADNRKGSVRDAIRDILGFSVAEIAVKDILNIKSEFRKELIAVDQTSEVGKLQSQLGNVEQALAQASEDLTHFKSEKFELERDKEKVDQQYRDSNIEVVRSKQKQRDSKESELQRIDQQMKQVHSRRAGLITKYAVSVFGKKVADQGIEFIDEKALKGTVPAPFNEQLVRDIIEQAKCICGTEIKEGTPSYANILKMVEKAADPVLLNRVQRARGQLTSIRKELRDASDVFTESRSELANIIQTREAVSRDLAELSTDLKNITFDEIADKEKQRDHLKKSIAQVDRSIWSKERDILEYDKKIEELKGKISRLGARTPEISLLNKRIAFAELLESKLTKLLKDTESNSRNILMTKINDFLKKYVRQDYLASLSESYDIVLYDNKRNKVATSDGQALLLSLTFISALISIAKERLSAKGEVLQPGATAPFVIDAPFGVLDNEYKSNIARELPGSVSQIVFLLSSSHWEGAVESAIRSRVGAEYNMVLEVSSAVKQSIRAGIDINGKLHETVRYDAVRDMTRIEEVSF
jgi:DNA sulfur modification protein DndD